MMKTIEEAHGLRIDAEMALKASRDAREHYIQGLRQGLNDDDMRHRHYDAMEAASQAGNAQHILLGQRHYEFLNE